MHWNKKYARIVWKWDENINELRIVVCAIRMLCIGWLRTIQPTRLCVAGLLVCLERNSNGSDNIWQFFFSVHRLLSSSHIIILTIRNLWLSHLFNCYLLCVNILFCFFFFCMLSSIAAQNIWAGDSQFILRFCYACQQDFFSEFVINDFICEFIVPKRYLNVAHAKRYKSYFYTAEWVVDVSAKQNPSHLRL